MARLPVDWLLWAPVRRNIRAAQCRMSISTVKSYLQSSAGRSRLGRPAAPNLGGTCRTHGDRCRSRRRPSAVGSGARGAAVALDRRDDGGDELQENKQIPAPALCRALRTEVSARTGFDAVSDGSFRRALPYASHVARCMLQRCIPHVAFRMLHLEWCISFPMLHFARCTLYVAPCRLRVVCCALHALVDAQRGLRVRHVAHALHDLQHSEASAGRVRRSGGSAWRGGDRAQSDHIPGVCPAPVQMRVW